MFAFVDQHDANIGSQYVSELTRLSLRGAWSDGHSVKRYIKIAMYGLLIVFS